MSDWLKTLFRWVGVVILAIVGWLGIATDLPERVMTSIVGTRS